MSVEWSIVDEIRLLRWVSEFKPAGIHKHFHMICILERMNNPDKYPVIMLQKENIRVNKKFTAKQVWAKLRQYYDLDEADKLENDMHKSNNINIQAQLKAEEETDSEINVQSNSARTKNGRYSKFKDILKSKYQLMTQMKDFTLPWDEYGELILANAKSNYGNKISDLNGQNIEKSVNDNNSKEAELNMLDGTVDGNFKETKIEANSGASQDDQTTRADEKRESTLNINGSENKQSNIPETKSLMNEIVTNQSDEIVRNDRGQIIKDVDKDGDVNMEVEVDTNQESEENNTEPNRGIDMASEKEEKIEENGEKIPVKEKEEGNGGRIEGGKEKEEPLVEEINEPGKEHVDSKQTQEADKIKEKEDREETKVKNENTNNNNQANKENMSEKPVDKEKVNEDKIEDESKEVEQRIIEDKVPVIEMEENKNEKVIETREDIPTELEKKQEQYNKESIESGKEIHVEEDSELKTKLEETLDQGKEKEDTIKNEMQQQEGDEEEEDINDKRGGIEENATEKTELKENEDEKNKAKESDKDITDNIDKNKTKKVYPRIRRKSIRLKEKAGLLDDEKTENNVSNDEKEDDTTGKTSEESGDEDSRKENEDNEENIVGEEGAQEAKIKKAKKGAETSTEVEIENEPLAKRTRHSSHGASNDSGNETSPKRKKRKPNKPVAPTRVSSRLRHRK